MHRRVVVVLEQFSVKVVAVVLVMPLRALEELVEGEVVSYTQEVEEVREVEQGFQVF